MKTILEDCLQVCICTNCTIYQLTVSSHKIVNSCKQSEMRSQILNCKQKLKSTRKQIQWRDQSCVLSALPPPCTTQLSSHTLDRLWLWGPVPSLGQCAPLTQQQLPAIVSTLDPAAAEARPPPADGQPSRRVPGFCEARTRYVLQ